MTSTKGSAKMKSVNPTFADMIRPLWGCFLSVLSLILVASPLKAAPPADPTFGVIPLASQKGLIDETLTYQIWVQNNDKGNANDATLIFTGETHSSELTIDPLGNMGGTIGPRNRLELDPLVVTPNAGAQVGQTYQIQANFVFSRPGVPDFPITINCEYLVVDPVRITTTSPLPDWEVGVYDFLDMEATGGDGSYGWTVVSGQLPDGLSLFGTGFLSGTPTTVESQTFTVRASDGPTNWDEREFTMSIVSTPVREELPLPIQSNQTTKNILIIPIGIAEPAPSYDYLNEVFFTNTFSLRYFYQESSYNKLAFNPVGSGSDITPPYQYPGTTSDSRHEITAAAEAWAADQGYDLSAYDLYYFFSADAVEGGVGRLMRIYAFDHDSFTPEWNEHGLIHEVGHTLGLGHSNSLFPDGSIKEYGDNGSAMGAGSRAQIHGMHKVDKGWIDQARMQTIEASGIYSLYRTEDWGDGNSVQLLKIVDPNTLLVYYIGYRVPIGYDATFGDSGGDHEYPNRLHIHRNEFSHLGTILEDTLATGESWTEPVNGAFTIGLVSQDGLSAQVEVTFPPDHTPAPPPTFKTPIATVTPNAFQSTTVVGTALEYTILLSNVDTGSTLVGIPVLDAINYDPNFLTVVHKQKFGALEVNGYSGRLPASGQIIQPIAAGGSPGFLGANSPFVVTSKPSTPPGQYPVVFDIHMTREGGNTSTFQVTCIYEVATLEPPDPNAPKGHWKLDEGVGVLANNPYGNNGTLYGDPKPMWIDGRLGSALSFIGAGYYNYVDVPDEESLRPDTALSIATWFRFAETAGTGWLIEYAGNSGYALKASTSALSFTLNNQTVQQLGALNDDQWHLLVGTWDGSSMTMRLYVDGGPPVSAATSFSSLSIPIDTLQFGVSFTGGIDDVRLYDRELSAAEIADLYNVPPNNPPVNGAPTRPSTPTGPISVFTGVSETFSTAATDPEGDAISYLFGWGDLTTTPSPDGTASHAWAAAGSRRVRAMAIDEYGNNSLWSGPLNVSITEPPATATVTITSPIDGQALSAGIYTFTANTTGTVASVSFYIDGQLISTDTTAPYESIPVTFPKGRKTDRTIDAVARDGAGAVLAQDTTVGVKGNDGYSF